MIVSLRAAVLAGVQTLRAEARVLEHQIQFGYQQQSIKADESGEAEIHAGWIKVRRAQMGRQDAADRPWLPPVFGDDPAHLGGYPRQRNAVKREPQQPFLFGDRALRGVVEGGGEDEQYD